jgi:hypothetical protein
MLHDPDRHEALQVIAWDEQRARDAIERIVSDTVQRFSPSALWPWHPRDLEPSDDPANPPTPMYFGAAGTMWAIAYLQAVGAASTSARFDEHFDALTARNRTWLSTMPGDGSAGYLMGDTPVLMMAQGHAPTAERADALASLIERNLEHPARELMWGSPGTMLAALFLHRRFGDERWAVLFRRSAARLREQLKWSDALACHYWDQDMYGRQYTFLDAVHGFVANAGVLVRGRNLLAAEEWVDWARIIAATVINTAVREDGKANWPVQLSNIPVTRPKEQLLMQFCHGSPGFVICLVDYPGTELDELLIEAGVATWAAGQREYSLIKCNAMRAAQLST